MKTLIILAIIAALGITLILLLIRYGMKYWASEELKNKSLPGDDLIKEDERVLYFTKEIEIDAPSEIVYQHAAQQGQHKAGFYSFELLERIFTFRIRNTYHIVPEWTRIKSGDWIPYHQLGIGSEIIEVEDGKYFTMLSDSRKPPVNKGMKAFALNPMPGGKFAWCWNFIVEPVSENKSILIQRCYNYFTPNNFITNPLIRFFIGIPSIVMTTRQMELIKRSAEGNPPK